MLIYVKKKKKNVFHRTDRRTDTRSTQNYSSEPHKKANRNLIYFILCLFELLQFVKIFLS
jgi:hypothetical protein